MVECSFINEVVVGSSPVAVTTIYTFLINNLKILVNTGVVLYLLIAGSKLFSCFSVSILNLLIHMCYF